MFFKNVKVSKIFSKTESFYDIKLQNLLPNATKKVGYVGRYCLLSNDLRSGCVPQYVHQ